MTENAAVARVPRGCSSLKLRQLSRLASRHFDREVSAAGLKTTQYSLLSHVVELGPLRPGDLADALEMDASTLTRNVRLLIREGWIEQLAGDDARSRHLVATPAGRAKRSEAQRSWKRAQLAFNARVGDERVARLHAILDECLAALGEPAAPAGLDRQPD